jgi:integrase
MTESGKRYRVLYRKPDHIQTQKRGFRTKKEAELFLASVEIKKATGEFIDASAARITIGELGVEWLGQQTHLKPSSIRPVRNAWRTYVEPVWGAYAVGQIRHGEVQSWVSSISDGRSATTVLRAYGVLASILDRAVRERRIPSNPARGISLPRKSRSEHKYLSHQQVDRLAQHSGKRETLVYLLAYTGLRWGEAIALRTSDIDLDRRRINISVNAVELDGEFAVGSPKSHKRRSVAFPQFLHADLAALCAGKTPNELVFADDSGNYLRRARVSAGSHSWFKTALAKADLDTMTIHDLRHTAASLAISSGANVKAVQRMLGHASAAMTLDVYADLFEDDVDAVAEALDHSRSAAIVAKVLPPERRQPE